MRLAITGVSGFIGSVIARRLTEAGHDVTGLVRASSRRDHIERFVDRFVVGDQADESVWPELLDGADVVIHNSTDWSSRADSDGFVGYIRTNLVGSLHLLRASAPRPFVFMSTIGVHHDMRPRWGGLIDEDHPTRPPNTYGAYKAAVENFLWAERHAHKRACCALRPCAVYGIDPRLDRSLGYPIVRQIRAGHRFERPGGGKFVHVDDVAAVTVACATAPEDAPPVANLADCYARWADWAAYAAEILGIGAEINFSSPERPSNTFTKDVAQEMGVVMDRGHEGIKSHLRELIEVMEV